MSNIVSIMEFKARQEGKTERVKWVSHFLSLNKMKLLEELVKYQEERLKTNSPSLEILDRGIALCEVLADTAETPELRTHMIQLRQNLLTQRDSA